MARLFNIVAFDSRVEGTDSVESSSDLDEQLGTADELVLQVRVTHAEGTSPTLSLDFLQSGDGETWIVSQALLTDEDISTTPYSTLVAYMGPIGARGRLRVTLGGTSPEASVKVIACGRGKKLQTGAEPGRRRRQPVDLGDEELNALVNEGYEARNREKTQRTRKLHREQAIDLTDHVAESSAGEDAGTEKGELLALAKGLVATVALTDNKATPEQENPKDSDRSMATDGESQDSSGNSRFDGPRAFLLNEIYYFWKEYGSPVGLEPESPKYGSYTAINTDIDALGVDFVRHPGHLQLYYDWVLYNSSWRSVEWPTDEADLHDAVSNSAAVARLRDVLEDIKDRGLDFGIMLTLIGTGDATPDPGDRTPEGGTYGPVGETYAHHRPMAALWANHRGSFGVRTSVVDDHGNTVHFDTGPFFTASLNDLYTLQPSSAYKRHWLRRFAQFVAVELVRLREVIFDPDTFDVADHIVGLQIGNEIEHREAVDDHGSSVPDGESWAWLYYEMATGIRVAMKEASTREWDLPIWMPGLASWQEEGGTEPQCWDAKVDFISDFLEKLDTLCDPGTSSTPNPDYYGYSVSEIVSGMDVHWFHRSREDAWPLAFMFAELRELNSVKPSEVELGIMAMGVNVYSPVDPAAEGTLAGLSLAWPGLRPSEWGAENYSEMDWHGLHDDNEPSSIGWMYDGNGDPVQASDFAARSVWWRWSVALAAGASTVAWHNLLSNSNSVFAAMGVRRDQHAFDEGIEVAEQRPSWSSVNRFIALLGHYETVTAIHPDPSGEWAASHELMGDAIDLGFWRPSDTVWVIEFSAPSTSTSTSTDGDDHSRDYAYLLFVDPYAVDLYAAARYPVVSHALVSLVAPWMMTITEVPTRPIRGGVGAHPV